MEEPAFSLGVLGGQETWKSRPSGRRWRQHMKGASAPAVCYKQPLCDKHHRRMFARLVQFQPHGERMTTPILLTLAALYTVFGIVVVRRFRKPTCRVCLYRQVCPNRESLGADAKCQPCWSCGRTTACSGPDQNSKG